MHPRIIGFPALLMALAMIGIGVDKMSAAPENGAPAPGVKPAAPEAKPAAPEAKPAAPETKPAAPETKPAVSEVKPAVPKVKRPAIDTKTKPPAIVYIGYSSTNAFWLTVKTGAQESAKKLGVNFMDLTATKPDVIEQKSAIDNAILKKVDGLLLGAVDPRGLTDSLDKAKAANIPVIAVGEWVGEHPAVFSRLYTDEVAGAGLAGDYIVKRMNGKGKILILGGNLGSMAAEHRRKGVEEPCKKAGIEVLFRPADWLENKANEITQNELATHSDITGIFAACDPMIMTAKQAVKRKGLGGKILLVGYDGIPACLKAIKSGEVDATVRQDPARMGRQGMEMMVQLLNGEEIDTMVSIAPTLIDKNNVDQYLAP
ncbi:MAG: sugar ABC transporter substrate-binding protein [Candidatus Sumerlaeota bacterium]|nr:sugar ABC transporter substrate-binding protein [Candidatus Sumerlaeota bacterium]